MVSSEILDVELRCAARRQGVRRLLPRVDAVLADIDLLPLSAAVLRRAGEPFDRPQRALDAIHLATALDLGLSHLVLVTYDADQAAAARAEGLRTVSPA